MPATALQLTQLREQLAAYAPKPTCPTFACTDLPDGLPRGAVSEIVSPTGAGKVSFVLRFLAAHPELHTAWVEREHTLYPPAVAQHGVGLQQFWLFEAGTQATWTALEILRSAIFEVIVLDQLPGWNTASLRRLQLAAEQSKSCVLLLNTEAQANARWALARRIHVDELHRTAL